MTAASVASIQGAIQRRYPPELAADWDAVGLVCGEPGAPVDTVLLAVDPDPRVVDEAIELGAQVIVAHHPLLLRGVHSVAATDAKGRILHRLIRAGIALITAHTNADHADPGVSDALAQVLGVSALRPLDPIAPGSPYGTGRVGELAEALSLADFAARVATRLPRTHHGVRVAGDGARLVRRVAVCGGSGDSLLGLAAECADVYVTSDLRHHRAGEHRNETDCALIDVAHWASEWPWLEQAAQFLVADTAGAVRTVVSTVCTDPWDASIQGSAVTEAP